MATLFFLHIPKNAGMALLDAFRSAVGRSKIHASHDGNYRRFFGDLEKYSLEGKVVYGHFPFGAERRLGVTSQFATMVRNPRTRVLSMYHYLHQSTRHPEHSMPVSNSIAECVERYPLFRNQQARLIAGQEDYDGDQEELAGLAINNVDRFFSAVGVTELFEESLVVFGANLGWSRHPFYVRRNESKHGGWDDLQADTQEVVVAANQADLAVYKHCKAKLENEKQAIPKFQTKLDEFRRCNRRKSKLLRAVLRARDARYSIIQSVSARR